MPKKTPDINPDTRRERGTTDTRAEQEEKEQIDPVRFLSYEMVMKLIHDNEEKNPVRIGSFRFNEETAPDSSASPHDSTTSPEDPKTSPLPPPFDNDFDGPDEQPDPEESTITVPDNSAISEPPPSYMSRNTNRPPLRRDLRSLAEYHTRKKKP